MAKKTETAAKKTERYFEAIGRRKTAVARVRLTNGKGRTIVNQTNLENYFRLPYLRQVVQSPLEALKIQKRFDISVNVKGGGLSAQAEAVRLGLARALVIYQSEFKKRLRTYGFLTRDPRAVERKKYGYKKARRAPQWQKR